MMNKSNRQENDHQMDRIIEIASEFSRQLQENARDLGVIEELEQWFAQDPRHLSAFNQVQKVWDLSGRVSSEPEIMTLRKETLNRINNKYPARGFWGNNWAKWGVAATFVLLLIGGGAFYGEPTSKHNVHHYFTDVGGRQTISLEDGSVLELNTNSRATVSFKKGSRNIHLIEGQAIFNVAHDTNRPFIVTSSNGEVTALGTQFEVRDTGDVFSVTLLDGSVVVALDALNENYAQDKKWILLPGTQLFSKRGSPLEIVDVNTKELTSWRKNMAVFHDAPLSKVITEMNRYTGIKVKYSDLDLGELRISGAFKTGLDMGWIEALSFYYPIKVETEGSGNLVLSMKN